MIKELAGLQSISFNSLNELYAPCCEHNNLPQLAAGDDDLQKKIDAMVQQVYDETGLPKAELNKEITEYFANHLWNGVTDGYGSDLSGIDYNTPDYNMLESLQKNVWQFSAAKNYQQLVSLSKALVDDDGKLRTFAEFKRVASTINDQYINQWLRTEYDTAVGGAQMASKWTDIKENSATKLLEFDAVMDTHTSELCSSLNGVKKPVDDEFWNTYYPPNHFNCRSTVRQLNEGEETPTSKIVYPEKMPAMFKTNLAKQGLVFPKSHPYYDGCPHNVLNEAVVMMHKNKTGE